MKGTAAICKQLLGGKEKEREKKFEPGQDFPSLISPFLLHALDPPLTSKLNPVDHNPLGSSVHGDSPGKNTGVGCHSLLQGIFPTQGSNPGLRHSKWILYCLSHLGSPTGQLNQQELISVVLEAGGLRSEARSRENPLSGAILLTVSLHGGRGKDAVGSPA